MDERGGTWARGTFKTETSAYGARQRARARPRARGPRTHAGFIEYLVIGRLVWDMECI